MNRPRYCNHCAATAMRSASYCSPCRTRRILFGEAGASRIEFSKNAGSWRGYIHRWKSRSREFRDEYWFSVARCTLEGGQIVVEELERPKLRRPSTVIVRSLASPIIHSGLVRRLSAGRAALAGGMDATIATHRTLRCGIAHWMRSHGSGGGRPLRCRETIRVLTTVVERVENLIEPLLLECEKKARKRAIICANRERKARTALQLGDSDPIIMVDDAGLRSL